MTLQMLVKNTFCAKRVKYGSKYFGGGLDAFSDHQTSRNEVLQNKIGLK